VSAERRPVVDPQTQGFLSPGQRYVPISNPLWRADRQLTIGRVGYDRSGLLRVAYSCPEGHRVIEPAAQFEAAVVADQLVPVGGAGSTARAA
jgi:hypothetical protein